MAIYEIDIEYDLRAGLGVRGCKLAEMFGVGGLLTRREVVKGIEVEVGVGDVTYLCGRSGSGKSSIMRELKGMMALEGYDICDIEDLDFDRELSLVDIMKDVSLDEAMKWLCKAGLAEVYKMMSSYDVLSVGEQFRFRLALAMHRMPELIFIDEFCSSIDDVSASILCANICRAAKEYGFGFVLAGVNDKLSEYLGGGKVIQIKN